MTQREKELEASAARLARQLEAIKPFICTDAKCKERKRGSFCPHCGNVIFDYGQDAESGDNCYSEADRGGGDGGCR